MKEARRKSEIRGLKHHGFSRLHRVLGFPPSASLRSSALRLRTSLGFTLVEIITVIAIIAILAGTLLAVLPYLQRRAAQAMTLSTIHSVSAALESYKADFGVYPVDRVNQSLRTYAGTRRPERVEQNPYSKTGSVNASMSLWYHLEHAMLDLGRRPYISYKRQQLVDDDRDKTYGAADGHGNHLAYKSNNPNSYQFAKAIPPYPRYAPRNRPESYDLCSYGQDRTTWKTYDPIKRTGTKFTVAEMNNNYDFGPWERLCGCSGVPHSHGGEDDDDVNNWQQQN